MGAWEDAHNEGIDQVVAMELAAANERIAELDDQVYRTEIERDAFERVLTNAAADAMKTGRGLDRHLRAV